jgi:hypothetical protein
LTWDDIAEDALEIEAAVCDPERRAGGGCGEHPRAGDDLRGEGGDVLKGRHKWAGLRRNTER